MTVIFIEIAQPSYYYNRAGIYCDNIMSENECVEQIKNLLQTGLKKYGVNSVLVKVGGADMYHQLFSIKMVNTRNDWQEEQIRLEIDNICLDFIDRKNLQKLCN